ncbi:MAG: aspartate kinase [bacterium]
MIVMKFGSSSLKDTKSVQQVAAIIKSYGFAQRIVVLSAVNTVTDLLISGINRALKNENCIPDIIQEISNLHLPYLNEKMMTSSSLKTAKKEINKQLDTLKRLLQGISYTKEATSRNCDHIVTIGERLSVQIMKGCLESLNCKAAVVETDRIGLLAKGEWGNGSVDLEASKRPVFNFIHNILKTSSIPLVTGFFGQTKKGEPITFGRGGSDYSSAVLAHLVNAKRLEIWKDVDGFLNGSPEFIEQPKPLKNLSYDEAAELSYFGAKILHPRTVEPLFKDSIPIVIKNTYNPNEIGTWINGKKWITKEIIKSITYDKNIAMLRIHGVDVGYTVGLLGNLVTSLSKAHINIRSVMTSQTCINIILDQNDINKGYAMIKKLDLVEIDQIDLIKEIGLVGIVGEGLAESEEPLKKVIETMGKKNLHAELFVTGASKIASYFIIQQNKLEQAVQAAHNTIFNQ